MAGQGASQNYSQTVVSNTVFNVRVTQPITDNSSKEIRDNILSDFFGYGEFDIKALDEQKKGYFYISDEKTPKEWATGKQVKLWNFNPDGTVRINMPQALIDNLSLLRAQRASLEIFKVGMFITDSETRRQITDALENILSSSGDKRISALNDLMMTIAGSQTSRGEIYKALRSLTNEAGYKNNPFLLIAFAATTSYKSKSPAFGSEQVNQGIIASAVKAANESFYASSSKSALTKINRQEAAQINFWASDLYTNINADYEARNRRWIERFLNMSDDERNSYNDGDLIPINPTNQTVMRATTNAERDYVKNEKDFEERNRQWQKEDNIGAPQPVKTDHRTSQLFQNPNDTFEKEGWDIKKNRGTDKGYQPKVAPGLKPNEFNPYSRGNVRADGYGAVLTLYLEAAKFYKFQMRMQAITNYLNTKGNLERQIRNERVRLKPPPPEVTLEHIKEFRRYGRITANPFEKRQIIATINQLYVLLEEGRAYYK